MPDPISRRELLKWFSAGAGAAAVGGATWYAGRSDRPSTEPTPVALGSPSPAARPPATAPLTAMGGAPAPTAVPDVSQRLLVVVEMGGGNDGMSTLVPYGIGAYHDLRPNTALGGDSVLAIDDEVGFHADLARTAARGAAVLQGVGVRESDGSHFEMLARWWAGALGSGSAFDTGFLGRLADAIGDPAAPAVALSVGSGSHPALVSRTVGTLSIPDAGSAWYLTGAGEDDWLRMMFQQGFARFGQGSSPGGVDGWKRALMSQSVAFADVLDVIEDDDSDAYPGSDLGRGLQFAARLFTGDIGVRIVHVPMNVDFDTHDDHNGRYPALMQDFDACVDAFFADLEGRGLADRVLLATTSEFGRTAHDNDSYGLDHGTASNMLLMGPVVAGRHGEHPSLDTLDDNDDLVPTVGLDEYYATIAEHWFGVPASEVLAGSPAPVAGIIA